MKTFNKMLLILGIADFLIGLFLLAFGPLMEAAILLSIGALCVYAGLEKGKAIIVLLFLALPGLASGQIGRPDSNSLLIPAEMPDVNGKLRIGGQGVRLLLADTIIGFSFPTFPDTVAANIVIVEKHGLLRMVPGFVIYKNAFDRNPKLLIKRAFSNKLKAVNRRKVWDFRTY